VSDITPADHAKVEKMSDVHMNKAKTWKTKGSLTALIAVLAIGTVAALSVTVYGGYWWGNDVEDVANEQPAGEAAPVPADIESNAINMEE